MLVGMVRLNEVWNQQEQLENHVESLIERNEALWQEYESGYDLEEVEKTALALGMVPAQQVEHVYLGD